MRRRHFRARGYTLMELVVASMIAMLVIAGLYVVYAGHSRVFRGQEMVSQAQVTARFAMEVVKNDLRRAGFMSVADTNDAQTKQHLCGQPAVGRIKAISIFQELHSDEYDDLLIYDGDDSTIRPTQVPDTLVLVGNFADSEAYWVDRISGNSVTLQNNRAFDQTEPFPATQAAFDTIFDIPGSGASSLARIRHQDKVFFSIITGADFSGRTVSLANGPGCMPGLWDGAQLNVVNRIRYRVVRANQTTHGTLTDSEEAHAALETGLAKRYDLVREVMDWEADDATGVDDYITREVVAENVVDFQVWLLFDANNPAAMGPEVEQVGFALDDEDLGGPPCASGPIGTETCPIDASLSAVVRLSVRTRREDPAFLAPPGAVRPLQWYDLDTNTQGAARVRTLVSQVELPNIGYGR